MIKIFVYGFANTPFFFNEVFKVSKRNNENIEWGIIYPSASYKDSSNNLLKQENIFYLYDDFNKYYQSSEKCEFYDDYIFNIDGDNIHKMIKSSKHGYAKVSSNIQEKNAHIIYRLYREFLVKTKPSFVVFPDLEQVDGIILLNLCKELNIGILYTVHTRLLGETFFAQDYKEKLPIYYGDYEKFNISKAETFLDLFKSNQIKAYQKKNYGDESIEIVVPNIFKRFIVSMYNKIKYENNGIIETTFFTKLLILFPQIHNIYLKFKFKYLQKKYFYITSLDDQLPKKFILFPLQMTPESSINTLSQYFIEQEKLIDLVQLNMPHNYYLLVKEHPVMNGFRCTSFYKNIATKSGVFLVSADINTQELVDKSKLVVTITGTIGLEAYLKGKRIMMFGPTFFSHLCSRFNSYINLKEELQEALDKNKTININELAKIYNISYDFILNDPLFHKEVMQVKNIENFIKAIKIHISRVLHD